MKKSIKYLSLILFCFLFMVFLSNSNVSARYDRDSNKVHIAVNKNEVKITVKFQRGMDTAYSEYKWCEKTNANTVVDPKNPCKVVGETKNYVTIGGDASLSYIAQGDAEYVDNNLTTYTFKIPKAQDELLKNQLIPETYYAIIVVQNFCAYRLEGSSGQYEDCGYYDTENIYTVLDVSSNDLINGKEVGGNGSATDDIDDDNIKGLMEKINDIVHGTVMPIIWVVLGLFLVVKGALLGVQIVKAADEPQVRQEKIGSLKWLVIGVGIAYASSFVVDLVIGFFSDAFK